MKLTMSLTAVAAMLFAPGKCNSTWNSTRTIANSTTAPINSNTTNALGPVLNPDVNITTPISSNTTNALGPVLNPDVDTHDIAQVVPQTNVTLLYGSNTTDTSGVITTHEMKYATVILEHIASISSVDCSADSVAITFNDSSVFDTTQSAWSAEMPLVMITNHLGDCDAELERGFFLASGISFDNSTLVATASSQKVNISSTASESEIIFGNIPTGTVAKRDKILNPSYSINTALALPADTTLFSYAPYLTVIADDASFTANVTFSGYLKYSWLTFKVKDLYFDIDTGFTSAIALSADATIGYSHTFSYSPVALTYGVSVPGIVELGPELQFSIGAFVEIQDKATLTTELELSLADGKVHVDLLNEDNTSTSGWTPQHSASVNISNKVIAQINPYVAVTVELAISAFDNIINFSSGLTAKPGFNNTFTLTTLDSDVSGVQNVTNDATCDGLEIATGFTFSIIAFVTKYYSKTLYSVGVPLFDGCYDVYKALGSE